MSDIIELHAELQRNRIEAGLEKEDTFVPRFAKAQKQLDQDIEDLYKDGITEPYHIARILGRHPTTIQMRLGSVQRRLEKVRDIDILTGSWRSQGGYVGIYPR
jgi:hypothetical protein